MRFWRRRPYLSIVVVVYRMPDQAEKTLQSLSPFYQQGVREKHYEVVVVENDSDRLLGRERATRHAGNVRYFHRHETQRTPVHACNEGVARARGTHVAIMIDGARMLSPGVVRQTLEVYRATPRAAVCTPGFHLGHKLQQEAVQDGYDARVEAALLDGIAWPMDGYRLFEISVFSGTSGGGFFLPMWESNYFAMPMTTWRRLRGMDRRYDDFGGGNCNLDLFKRLLEQPKMPLVLLFGEGSFHQFHGGVTTNTLPEERAHLYQQLAAQDIAIRGQLKPPPWRPMLYGTPHPATQRFLQKSLERLSA
jgi:glycosyltransferase involved in cell wall biosynthesis